MTKSQISVFALDDDPGDLEILKRTFEEIRAWPVDFTPFTKWDDFRAAIANQAVDVMFVDYLMGNVNGIDAIRQMRADGENRPVIVLTGKGDEKVAARIIRAGADDYLVKGELTADLIRRAVDSVIAQFRAKEERAVLEKQLRESRKMETLGALAGGIAHDFNNLLMAIMGYADFAKMKSKDSNIEEDLNNIISTSKQMANLVKQLLSFSRGDKDRLDLTDLRAVLLDTVNILKHTLPKTISVTVQPSDKAIWINANSTLLSQSLLNLCINAAEAMPEGGQITIKCTRFIVSSRDDAICRTQLSEGEYALLEVRDTGKGMSRETRLRIFEPFFTTKQMGARKGTGLGLSIVWSNIRKMNGIIDVFSEVNKGTVFKLYFCISRHTAREKAFTKSENFLGNREAILVVDDDDLVLNLADKHLSGLNYKVFTTSSGHEALALFKNMKDEIDLVLLDISMPGMDGKQCIKGLLTIDPKIRVIFSSGHDMAESAHELKALGGYGWIQKPYLMADLGKRIKQVLESGKPLSE